MKTLALVIALSVALVRAELLPWSGGAGYECDTYPWFLVNTQANLPMFLNGVHQSGMDGAPGDASTDVQLAWAYQPHASNITVVVVDESAQHAQFCKSTIELIAPGVTVLTNIANGNGALVRAINQSRLADVVCFPSNIEGLEGSNALARCKGLIVVSAPNIDYSYDVPGWNDRPSSWRIPNVLSVTGHDIAWNPVFASSTNIFDVAAPAWRLQAGTEHYYWNGNSAAAAITAGVAALVAERYHNMPAAEIKKLLIQSSTPHASLATHSVSGGALNAVSALLQPCATLTVESGQLNAWVPMSQQTIVIGPSNGYFHLLITKPTN